MRTCSDRRAAAVVLVLVLLLLGPVGVAGARPARARALPSPTSPTSATPTTAPLRLPTAFVIVDAATGAVISGRNDRVPRPPASTTKIITALVVRRRLANDAPVKVSARAAATPALKLSLKAGQTWRTGDLLRAMLLCSCNDAAVALAEAAGGSLAGFARLTGDLARRLGMRDRPVLRDPSGLDDEFSVGGGNLISARDLAIAARAFLNDHLLASIVVAPSHRFVGGDGAVHEVRNHNRLLGLYRGAIGVKTGYTRRAGSSLVAAARRNGRTIIAVLLDSPNVDLQAGRLLDIGFATPVRDLARLPHLTIADERAATAPASHPGSSTALDRSGPKPAGPAPVVAARGGSSSVPRLLLVVILAVVAAVALRRRQVVRRRQRRRAPRRGPLR